MSWRVIMKVLSLLAILTGATVLSACDPPEFERPVNLMYLEQGEWWTTRERAIYYYTPQGNMLHGLRYAWFQHLEGREGRLSDPAYLSRFGFLYSPEQFDPNFEGGELNPGNFPVGFVRHHDEVTGDAMLDISCAACHTGQLEFKGASLRVDGGQPMHALAWTKPGQLVLEILLALQSTYINPLKFDRFAEAVLGTRYPDAKPELREKLRKSIDGFTNEAITTMTLYKDHGYGRLDALGRIADTVLGAGIDSRNQKVTDAPVSYPHLWDIWRFDWVEWNGSFGQPLGRNLGEALGTKARLEMVDEHGDVLPADRLFRSSVLLREQLCIETALWQLGPPQWPENIFPAIDTEKAERGRMLYRSHCKSCHGPHVYPDEPTDVVPPVRYTCGEPKHEQKPTPGNKPVEWKMCVVPTWEIGTDPKVVNNFVDARYDASVLDPANPELRDVSAREALEIVIDQVTKRKIGELLDDRLISESDIADLEGWGRKNETRDMRGYKARPLHGVWATPPFLHNGSVRTIYQLLSPHAEREKKMWIGSREYDPVNLGYTNEELEWAFEFETSEIGNNNTGHQFTDAAGLGVIGRELTHNERMDLIEYIKILGHPSYDEADYREEYAKYYDSSDYDLRLRCPTDLQGPASNPELKWPR